MNSFRRLFVWEASIELAVRILAIAERVAVKRRFAVADQLSRAALSIPSNIAEGQGRSTTRDRRHYFVQARGSLYELETQLIVIERAGIEDVATDIHVRIKQISSGLTKIIDRLSSTT